MVKKQETAEVFCVDPALNFLEVDAFNNLLSIGLNKVSYHLPAILGMESIYSRQEKVNLKGVIIFGSHCSVNDTLSWQNPFHLWVEDVIRKKIPVLGLCYGHQLINSILGSEVKLLKQDGEVFKGFKKVKVSHSSRLKSLTEYDGYLVASHKEEVKKITSGVKPFLHASEVLFEGIYHEKLPLWGLQSHPEATWQFCQNQKISYNHLNNPFSFGYMILENIFKQMRLI
ncbi:MAG: hypothetical protein CMP11_07650 [Zetaproteobacteria bacterium]|nr:hypothetical protein [Pseudobdellovibrionaceae bacterium]